MSSAQPAALRCVLPALATIDGLSNLLGPQRLELGAIQVVPSAYLVTQASLRAALETCGDLIGWWELSDRVVCKARPEAMPAGHLLAADLTDGKGASYAVRHTPKGWVLTTMTRVASETAVLVRHVRLPRRNDGRVEFGNWQLEFEVCWTQVLDSKGERTLFPFASRFVGLI